MKATVTEDGMTVSEVTNAIYVERKTCRACEEPMLAPVLSLGDQYLVNFVEEIDHSLPKAPLDLMRCESCGLLQLGATVDRNLLYREFWYRSSVNQTMRDALRDVIEAGLNYHDSGLWLDIGANDGYLLSQVPAGFRKVACEPALNFAADLEKVADVVISDFFTAQEPLYSKRTGYCDVITSVAMFYDLDRPDDFVADIAACLSPEGVWINQLNDSPTMLKRNAFDAVCHEHLCYYDLHSLKSLYSRHGLVIVSLSYNEVNGGSMRVVARKAHANANPVNLLNVPRVTAESAVAFGRRVGKWKERMTELLQGSLSLHGPLWLYGASTKGCALLQYLDSTESFSAIADRNPAKLGLRMTGTWLPILSEERMREDAPRYLMVLPWAFRSEFIERESALLDQGTTMVFPLPNIELVG